MRLVMSALIARASSQKPSLHMSSGGGRPFVRRATPGASPNIASARISGRNLRAFTMVQVLLSPVPRERRGTPA